MPNGPSAIVTRVLSQIYGSLRHSPDQKMSGTKWQFLTVFRATLLTDLQLGYQAVRRFPGGKETTEVAAGSLARPSDKPHYPLYLLSLLSLLSPHPENRDIRYTGLDRVRIRRFEPAPTGDRLEQVPGTAGN